MFGAEPKETTYAKLTNPDNGWKIDVENAKLLTLGDFYEVASISMGQSSTTVMLKDYPRKPFGSVQFEFYGKNKMPIDIFTMPEFNPYLPYGEDQINSEEK